MNELPMKDVNVRYSVGKYPTIGEQGYQNITFQIPPHFVYYSPETKFPYKAQVSSASYPLRYSHDCEDHTSTTPIEVKVRPQRSIAIHSQDTALTFTIGFHSEKVPVLGGRIYPSVLPGEKIRVTKGEEAKPYGKELMIAIQAPRKPPFATDASGAPSFFLLHKLFPRFADPSSTSVFYPEVHYTFDEQSCAILEILLPIASDLVFLANWNSWKMQDLHASLLYPALAPIYVATRAQRNERYESIKAKATKGKADAEIVRWFREVTAEEVKNRKQKTCKTCGKMDEKMMRCGRCLSIYYCNAACQKQDYKEHKATCKSST